MKVISPQVIHKSDAGASSQEYRPSRKRTDAFRKISGALREKGTGAVLTGVMVEEHCPPGLEILIGGVRTDPSFGKVVTFGMGDNG